MHFGDCPAEDPAEMTIAMIQVREGWDERTASGRTRAGTQGVEVTRMGESASD